VDCSDAGDPTTSRSVSSQTSSVRAIGSARPIRRRALSGNLWIVRAADAILDGTIGLELVLGDDQNQSLSYKLRLRAAALAVLHADPAYPAAEVASKVKRLYEARSAVVHGRRKKRSKMASEPTDRSNAEERLVASDLLRLVLNVLLTNPEYQDPAKIDEGLLLRGDEIVIARKSPRGDAASAGNQADHTTRVRSLMSALGAFSAYASCSH
jgi:hypothetical protein